MKLCAKYSNTICANVPSSYMCLCQAGYKRTNSSKDNEIEYEICEISTITTERTTEPTSSFPPFLIYIIIGAPIGGIIVVLFLIVLISIMRYYRRHLPLQNSGKQQDMSGELVAIPIFTIPTSVPLSPSEAREQPQSSREISVETDYEQSLHVENLHNLQDEYPHIPRANILTSKFSENLLNIFRRSSINYREGAQSEISNRTSDLNQETRSLA